MRRGVDVTNVRTVTGVATGTAMVLVAPDGENVIVVDRGANSDLDGAHVESHAFEDRVTAFGNPKFSEGGPLDKLT